MMSGTHRRVLWLLSVSVLILVLALVASLSSCAVMRGVRYTVGHVARGYLTAEGRFDRIAEAAYRAREKGDYERSEQLYRHARDMRPDDAGAAYGHATALARLKREDAALQALRDAVRLGYDSAGLLEEDAAFRPYRDRAEFAESVEAVRRNEKARETAMREASVVPPAASVPSFATLAELEKTFEQERKALEKKGRARPHSGRLVEERRLSARRQACLVKYLDEHEGAADGEKARLASIKARVDLAGGFWGQCYRDLAEGIREDADAFIAAHPGSRNAAEVRLYRALAVMNGTLERDHDWKKESPPPLNCEGALPELTLLAAREPADPWTRRALGYKAVCLYQRDRENPSPAREAYEAFLKLPEPPTEQRNQLDYRARSLVRALRFQVEGAPEFTARTLDGKEVKLASFKGRVLLIDFWGPG